MKIIVLSLALVACVCAETPSAEYLPPNGDRFVELAAPSSEYLAPAVGGGIDTVVSSNGYRYKTVRRFRNRNRRDVSELPGAEYLPPHHEASIEIAAPSNEYFAPAGAAEFQQTFVGSDGYRYKTVRRFRNRNRRDVSELPGAEYLPPHHESAIEFAAPSNEYLAPAAGPATIVGNDGYRYKTVRKLKVHRH